MYLVVSCNFADLLSVGSWNIKLFCYTETTLLSEYPAGPYTGDVRRTVENGLGMQTNTETKMN